MIAQMLVESGDYQVTVGDCEEFALRRIAEKVGVKSLRLDASDRKQRLESNVVSLPRLPLSDHALFVFPVLVPEFVLLDLPGRGLG
jgi:hypothetical protein